MGDGMSIDRGFDVSYVGVPPWDIGRPQREVIALMDAGAFSGEVIDVGCGTGENALTLAEGGAHVLGIDASPRAVGKAIGKARDRGLSEAAEFLVADVFALEGLGRRFDAALDCGLFHVFDDHERPVYAASLAGVVSSGGALHLLCFSDRYPPGRGPRRLTEQEIRETFTDPWRTREIVPTIFETHLDDPDVPAWRASIDRV
jgi:cyclopropane fatty-acyl-phospholipid synthase-like methyltransferase